MVKRTSSTKEGSKKAKKLNLLQFIDGDNLNLSQQNLTDNDIMDIVRLLRLYPNIKNIDLSLNNIGDQGIADFAERNQTIIQANFTGNNISDRGVAVFAYKNQMIKQVNFSHNPITADGIHNFAVINQTCDNCQFSKIQYH